MFNIRKQDELLETTDKGRIIHNRESLLIKCVAGSDGKCTKCGAITDGWQKIDGKWKLIKDGEAQTGWIKDAGKWYYFGTSGVMTTGWKQIDSKWYYFGTDGVMVSNKTITIDGKKYTFNASGVWVK